MAKTRRKRKGGATKRASVKGTAGARRSAGSASGKSGTASGKSGGAKRKSPRAKRKAPWDRAPPKRAKHTKLSSKQKSAAKARAKRAGRSYPNLVDNMREARKKQR